MKVLVYTGALSDKHKRLIDETAAKAGVDLCYIDQENDVPDTYKEAEIVYGFGMNIGKSEAVTKNKNLKWVAMTSAGVDFLFKPGMFAAEDVIITNGSGSYGVTIAEYIIAVSLMMMRKLTYHYEGTLKGEWRPPVMQKSLKDCRIAVLGTGDIGTNFAKRARAFEPKSIVGICRSGKNSETFYDKVVSVSELDTVLPETDLLVMSLPATPETEGILSRERIALLPEEAYVVNVGRGSAVDEDALADALEADKLAGAALDVFRTEPLPQDSRLWKTKNLLITPHCAGNLTLDYTRDTNVELFCENLLNYVEGKPLNHVVDKEKRY